MWFTGLNTSQLLRAPSQQLAFGYLSGNPLVWVHPFGLASFDDFVEHQVKAGNVVGAAGQIVSVFLHLDQSNSVHVSRLFRKCGTS